MIFPSPEVARAVGDSKSFLDWMVANHIQDFNQAWKVCPTGESMVEILLALNPKANDLHFIAYNAALRVFEAENREVDELLIDFLARKRSYIIDPTTDYDDDAAFNRAHGK
jgi:hypothetical protein